MFRWIRYTVCGLLSAAALAVTVAWLIPVSDSLVNHNLILADEGNRYNVYAMWDQKFYHLRAFPEGHIVPHRFVVYLLLVLSDERVDSLSIEYRQLTKGPVTSRHIQLFRNTWVQRSSFAADPQTPAQDCWAFSLPIWLAVILLWAFPIIALIRGPIRRWRRRRRSLCVKCGYHLAGLTESRCPECGTGFSWEERNA